MSLYLSKLRLSRSPSAQALSALINPPEAAARRSAHHRLLWAAFADGPERARDFLWREEADGVFLTLSARPPAALDLFDPPEIKPFAPSLAQGDHLSFTLRANATRTKRDGKRVDVVMDALFAMPKGARAEERMAIASTEGAAWLTRQGARAGFKLLSATAEDYSAEVLEGYRGQRKGQPQFGILELTGQLEVQDPAAFLVPLAQGFGRAKAFGCGLMLLRRA